MIVNGTKEPVPVDRSSDQVALDGLVQQRKIRYYGVSVEKGSRHCNSLAWAAPNYLQHLQAAARGVVATVYEQRVGR
jgi:hypothetical protein